MAIHGTHSGGWQLQSRRLDLRTSCWAAKDLVSKKRKLSQAPPLTADMIWKLEGMMTSPFSAKIKAILGFMLFCTYSCCRFGDGARAQEPALSQFQHIILVETACAEYKTATGERRAVLLPLVALGVGLERDRLGPVVDGSSTGGWLDGHGSDDAGRLRYT